MRLRRDEHPGEEAFRAARELRPLVEQTHRVLGGIAKEGLRGLRGGDLTLAPESYPDDHSLRWVRVERLVKPEVAYPFVQDDPRIEAVSAGSVYSQLRYSMPRMRSLTDPARPLSMALPFSRSRRSLLLNITALSGTDRQPRPHSIAVSTAGRVSVGSREVSYPRPPIDDAGNHAFGSREDVLRVYVGAFKTSLALGWLVARSMLAFGVRMNDEPARALFNQWHETGGGQETTAGASWAEAAIAYFVVQPRQGPNPN